MATRYFLFSKAASIRAGFACLIFSLLTGCSMDRGLHLTTHPDFPPIVPIKDRQEIQVTWVRSWKPTIYLRAEFDSDDFDRKKRIRLSYSISKNFISPPRTFPITEQQWRRISDSLSALGFWENGWNCEERAYRERSHYFSEKNECVEIVLTDGAAISIAATNGERSKGVRVVCPDLELCEPLGRLPKTMLEIANLESEL